MSETTVITCTSRGSKPRAVIHAGRNGHTRAASVRRGIYLCGKCRLDSYHLSLFLSQKRSVGIRHGQWRESNGNERRAFASSHPRRSTALNSLAGLIAGDRGRDIGAPAISAFERGIKCIADLAAARRG